MDVGMAPLPGLLPEGTKPRQMALYSAAAAELTWGSPGQ